MRRIPVPLPLLCAAALTACDSKPADSRAPAPSASAAPVSPPVRTVQRIRVPTGPRYAVLPGQGVGPIRPGATVATIERHMQAKCEELTAERCRYVDRGIEFHLNDQRVLARMHIHRMGRAAGDGASWGPFHGAIPPDLAFGMLPGAIQEHLGKPKQVKPGADGAHPETVEQHVYDGVVLEYDRLPNGSLVLGGIRIPS